VNRILLTIYIANLEEIIKIDIGILLEKSVGFGDYQSYTNSHCLVDRFLLDCRQDQGHPKANLTQIGKYFV
jgi:hypothetical protein